MGNNRLLRDVMMIKCIPMTVMMIMMIVMIMNRYGYDEVGYYSDDVDDELSV